MILTSPLFLIGLVAVAIPIVVHLFNFRRYKKVYFSNVEFLEQLQSETRRQSNLRQLLIMAARILAIVFLVLAFAQPVIPNKNNPLRSGKSDISIFVDNSFSMDNTDGSEALLEKAKAKAREIVSAYSPTDRFQILTNDVEGRQFHWLSKEEALLAIDNVQTSSSSQTLSSIGQKLFDFLRSGKGQNKYAYFISDFQTSVTDFNNFAPDSSIVVMLVPLESAAQNNVYIDSLTFSAPVLYKGNSVVAKVRLRNEGDENLEKLPVALYVNERQRALASVDLAARSTSTVDLHFTIDETGILSGRVETNDYPIVFDDKYYFSLNIRENVNMLTVEGNGTNEFLQRLFGGDSAVVYNTLSLQQMDFSRLDGNDIVLLDELPSLGSGMAQSLHAFVEQGGTVVVVPNEKADINSYNETLRLFSAPQLTSYNPSRVQGGTIDLKNDLYRGVFEGNTDNLEMPSVTGYFRCQTAASTLREPIVTLANGDDYIVRVSCGEGRLYLITAPLRDAHTDFVRQALFVPTLYNMALYSSHPTPPAATLDQLEPILLSSSYDAGSGNVKLKCDASDFEEIPDIHLVGGKSYLQLHGSLHEAGNYIVEVDGKAQEGISFNYSRLESQMQFLGRDALEQMLKDYNLSHCSVVRNAEKPLDTYLKEQMEGRHLWRWCIVLSLFMLLIEILLIRLPIKQSKNNKVNP